MVDALSDTMETSKPPWRERKETYLIGSRLPEFRRLVSEVFREHES